MAKVIYCLAECFFQFDLQTNLMGGGERWWLDITNLFKKLGYNIECYQFSYDKKTVRYKNLAIKGLGNIRRNSLNINDDYLKGYNEFNLLAEKANADGIFYLSMNLCMATPKIKTLTISHGLMFDGKMPNVPFNSYNNLEMYKRWVRNSNKLISVDTNSIKVMQVYAPEISERMVYVPNYADTTLFTPSDSWLNTNNFRILFSRRLQWCRGYTYMMEATEELIKRIPNVEVTFCGKGNKAETDEFMFWFNKQDKNKVKYTYKDMSEMPNVYKNADIAIVPTTMAEGSSLSAIEAMSTGLPQILSWVGGLTDVATQSVQAIFIPPKDSNAIVEAVEYLYNNKDVMEEMRKNAIASSKAFGKQRWEKSISKIIKELYGEP